MGAAFNGGPAELRVAIAGLGSIGIKLVQALDKGIDGFVLAAVSARAPAKHEGMLAKLSRRPAIFPIEGLSAVADIVIECAPSNLLSSIVAPFLGKGKTACRRLNPDQRGGKYRSEAYVSHEGDLTRLPLDKISYILSGRGKKILGRKLWSAPSNSPRCAKFICVCCRLRSCRMCLPISIGSM